MVLPNLDMLLQGQGYGLYSIEYTQDFSGTLDRKALVEDLREVNDFCKQGTLCQAMDSDNSTIL